MNPVHEHCSSQIFRKKKLLNKKNLTEFSKNKIFKNKILDDKNVLNA